jgi:hypothetical protein
MTNKAHVSNGTWWSPKLYARLLELKKQNKSWIAIGHELKRSASSCSSKFAYETHASGVREDGIRVDRIDVPADVLADARRRMDAPRTLSALFFGDPPQGFSALDRMQNREAL